MAIEVMKSLLATIPYTSSSLASSKYESFYQTILMKAMLCSGNIDVLMEDLTNNGRIDLTLKTLKYIYTIELKKDSSASLAIEQIKKSN